MFIAINETWRLAPWADCLFACDARWWRARGPADTDFSGLRVIGFETHPGCVEAGVRRGVNRMIWSGRALGAGGNSGFQAVNFAARCGAARIVLTGFDMARDEGAHWHADHDATRGLTNPGAEMLRNCARILDAAAPDLAARGVEILNASRRTALRAYRRIEAKEIA